MDSEVTHGLISRPVSNQFYVFASY